MASGATSFSRERAAADPEAADRARVARHQRPRRLRLGHRRRRAPRAAITASWSRRCRTAGPHHDAQPCLGAAGVCRTAPARRSAGEERADGGLELRGAEHLREFRLEAGLPGLGLRGRRGGRREAHRPAARARTRCIVSYRLVEGDGPSRSSSGRRSTSARTTPRSASPLHDAYSISTVDGHYELINATDELPPLPAAARRDGPALHGQRGSASPSSSTASRRAGATTPPAASGRPGAFTHASSARRARQRWSRRPSRWDVMLALDPETALRRSSSGGGGSSTMRTRVRAHRRGRRAGAGGRPVRDHAAGRSRRWREPTPPATRYGR